MRKYARKMAIMLTAAIITVVVTAGAAGAATWADWSANYLKGAPQDSANPIAYVSLPYWSNGYNIHVSSLSGSSDRRVVVTTTNAGGLTVGEQMITAAPSTTSVWTNNAISGDVQFKIVAKGSVSCNAAGSISIR